MSKDGSEQVRRHFAANARDLTPASARSLCRVLHAPVSPDPEVTRLCASVLSQAELLRAGCIASESEKTLFKQRRAFRRLCGATVFESPESLSQIEFQVTENGRPYLSRTPDTWFSFSSNRFGFLAAWSSTHGLGVDIEDKTRHMEANELASHYFSKAEAKAVSAVNGRERMRTFYRFWSLKEAALKSIGEGLPFGLDAFQFKLDSIPKITHAPLEHGGSMKFSAFMIEEAKQCAALVARSRI